MGTMLLLSSIIYFLSGISMLVVLKWDFEKKDHCLKLFQIGYSALMFMLALTHITGLIKVESGIIEEHTSQDFAMDIIRCLFIIPYIVYNFKKKLQKFA